MLTASAPVLMAAGQSQTPREPAATEVLAAPRGAATLADRIAAAAAALQAQDAEALREALTSEHALPDVVMAIATAVVRAPEPASPVVFDALGGRLAGARDIAEAQAILAALERASSKTAVQACIDALADKDSLATRAQVFHTLQVMVGRDDLGDDASAWTTWWEKARWLPEIAWRTRLATWRGEQARRSRLQRDRAFARLDAALREMHARLPEEERGARLVSLLSDDLPMVRHVGLDLAERDLLNARALEPGVVAAIANNLQHADRSIRREAANLLSRLPGDGVEDWASAALERETDPATVESLLRIAARSPSAIATRSAVTWLESSNKAVRTEAARTLTASARSGGLDSPVLRSRALSAVRLRLSGALSAAEALLLVALGDEKDRSEALARLVSVGPASAGKTDADWAAVWIALAQRPDAAPLVLALEDKAPVAALSAAAKTNGGAPAVRTLLGIAARAKMDERAAALRDAAAALCAELPASVAKSVLAAETTGFHTLVLNRILENHADGGVRDDWRLSLLEDLAREALAAGYADVAAQAATLLIASAGAPEPMAGQRVFALQALAAAGRLDQALGLAPTVSPWMAALRESAASPWADIVGPLLARTMLEQFSDTLSPADREFVVAALDSAPGKETEPGAGHIKQR